MTDLETSTLSGLTVKLNKPEVAGIPPVTLMFHGWTGDENSMWVFARNLPATHQVITIRGLYPSNHRHLGGYSWTKQHEGKWPVIGDFDKAVEGLGELLSSLSTRIEGDFSRVNLVGFSQGAALSYAFALAHPGLVKRIAGLAGFLPEGSDQRIGGKPLKGILVYMAHGEEDETVPIEMAYDAEHILSEAGAHVSFCKSDIGHRLGVNCFAALKSFMASAN